MEALGIGECESCGSLYFPGDEVFSHKGETLCSPCHSKHSVHFAGLVFCDG